MAPGGRLAYISPPAKLDARFVAALRARGRPERQFRFASACVEHACPQWTGDRCGIADIALEELRHAVTADHDALPACSIRRSCRWFSQLGRDACAICPLIVADTGGTGTFRNPPPEPPGT
jgi:hypothetical protein